MRQGAIFEMLWHVHSFFFMRKGAIFEMLWHEKPVFF